MKFVGKVYEVWMCSVQGFLSTTRRSIFRLSYIIELGLPALINLLVEILIS